MLDGRPIMGYLLFGLSAVFAALGAVGTGQAVETLVPGPAPVVIPFILWQLAVWSFLVGHFLLRRHERRLRERRNEQDGKRVRGQGVETS